MPQDGFGHFVYCGHMVNDKKAMTEWVKEHVNQRQIYVVIHAHISWDWIIVGDGDGDGDDDARRKNSKQPLRCKQGEPQMEILVVSAVSRDGSAIHWLDEIVRDKEGNLSIGKSEQYSDRDDKFRRLYGI